MRRPSLAVLLIGGVVLMASYWISFYRGGDVRVIDDECWEALPSSPDSGHMTR